MVGHCLYYESHTCSFQSEFYIFVGMLVTFDHKVCPLFFPWTCNFSVHNKEQMILCWLLGGRHSCRHGQRFNSDLELFQTAFTPVSLWVSSLPWCSSKTLHNKLTDEMVSTTPRPIESSSSAGQVAIEPLCKSVWLSGRNERQDSDAEAF